MNKEAYIIISSMDSYDRPTLEMIEGDSFSSTNEVYERLKSIDPSVTEMPSIIPIYDFTSDWNDTDDCGEYLNVMDTFICYVYITRE